MYVAAAEELEPVADDMFVQATVICWLPPVTLKEAHEVLFDEAGAEELEAPQPARMNTQNSAKVMKSSLFLIADASNKK